jgi:hypothetical protein
VTPAHNRRDAFDLDIGVKELGANKRGKRLDFTTE